MNKLIFIVVFLVNIFLFYHFLTTGKFTLPFVAIHIASILIFICSLTRLKKSLQLLQKHPTDVLLFFGLSLLALGIYVYKVGVIPPGLSIDELNLVKLSDQLIAALPNMSPYMTGNAGHATPLYYLIGLCIKFFGRNYLAIRFPTIFFGALSVGCFYLLLRLFFDKKVSVASSLLFLFSYSLIIISRIAFEVTFSLVFEILAVIFLYKGWKTKDGRYYMALGLSLGAGFYTYVGFQTFAVAVILLVFFLFIPKIKKVDTAAIRHTIILVLSLLFIVSPLLSYGINHPKDFLERPSQLSPSNAKNMNVLMSGIEVNIYQLTHVFFYAGNTHPEYNPATVSIFDLGTFCLLIIGVFFLIKNNKKGLALCLFFLLPSLVNDIFSFQFLPGGLIEYGFDHPDILRLAGIIPLFYFIVAYAFASLYALFESENARLTMIGGISVVVFLIALYNWQLYFVHPPDSKLTMSEQAVSYEMTDLINSTSANSILLPPSLMSTMTRWTDITDYFIRKKFIKQQFVPYSADEVIATQPYADLIIINYKDNPQLGKDLVNKIQSGELPFSVYVLQNADNSIDSFILGRNVSQDFHVDAYHL